MVGGAGRCLVDGAGTGDEWPLASSGLVPDVFLGCGRRRQDVAAPMSRSAGQIPAGESRRSPRSSRRHSDPRSIPRRQWTAASITDERAPPHDHAAHWSAAGFQLCEARQRLLSEMPPWTAPGRQRARSGGAVRLRRRAVSRDRDHRGGSSRRRSTSSRVPSLTWIISVSSAASGPVRSLVRLRDRPLENGKLLSSADDDGLLVDDVHRLDGVEREAEEVTVAADPVRIGHGQQVDQQLLGHVPPRGGPCRCRSGTPS